ncbi:MAG: AEC family transporter [Faecalimonas sp.]|nr:AEC family transporter [Faecalimonas sp.]
MDINTTISQIISLFLIMLVGYVMNKRGVIDDAARVRFTRLIINISLPAQILKAFVSNQGIVSNGEVLTVFGISLLAYALYAVLGILFLVLVRVPKEEQGTYLFMMMFGNVGFMGFPLVEAIYGEGALIYAVIFNVIFNLLVYSVGIMMIGKRGNGTRFEPKKLLNMPFLSAGLSLVLYFAKIQLPDVVMDSLDFLGNVTTPVAMLILGATIAAMPLKELFDEWRIYVFTLVKLLVVPLAAIAVLRYLPISSEIVKGSLIVLSATPVATNATMLAIEYDGDMALTSKGIFFTTLLCMVTIPLIQAFC